MSRRDKAHVRSPLKQPLVSRALSSGILCELLLRLSRNLYMIYNLFLSNHHERQCSNQGIYVSLQVLVTYALLPCQFQCSQCQICAIIYKASRGLSGRASHFMTRAPPTVTDFYRSSSWGRSVSKKSLVISKLSQLLAILGATFRRFGTSPLYIPFGPSCVMITLTASKMDLYW